MRPGTTFWFGGRPRAGRDGAFLLPVYDECLVSYRDDPQPRGSPIETAARHLGPAVVIDGRVAGTWKRRIAGDSVTIDVVPFGSHSVKARDAVVEAAERHGTFLQRTPVVRFQRQ